MYVASVAYTDSKSRNKKLAEEVNAKIMELKKIPGVNYLFSRLQTTYNRGIGIFGGAVRDWWLSKEPKDIDIVIDTDYFKEALEGLYVNGKTYNAFGGTALVLGNVKFDIWNLKDTQAFKNKQFEPSWENLIKSVPFNVDSVVVMLSGEVHQHKFWSALDNQEIQFINRTHAEPKFIAQRARLFATKYGFKLDKELEKFANDQLGSAELDNTLQIDPVPRRSSNQPVLLDVEFSF